MEDDVKPYDWLGMSLAAVSATRLATLLPQSAALDWDALQADARYLAAKLLLHALLS